jgi:hypothetical protein
LKALYCFSVSFSLFFDLTPISDSQPRRFSDFCRRLIDILSSDDGRIFLLFLLHRHAHLGLTQMAIKVFCGAIIPMVYPNSESTGSGFAQGLQQAPGKKSFTST